LRRRSSAMAFSAADISSRFHDSHRQLRSGEDLLEDPGRCGGGMRIHWTLKVSPPMTLSTTEADRRHQSPAAFLTDLSSAARRVCKYICQQLLPEMAHLASASSWFAKESWTNAGPALVLHAALAVWCNFNEMRRLLRSLESFGAILVCQSTLPKPRHWYSSHEAQSHGIATVMPVDSA